MTAAEIRSLIADLQRKADAKSAELKDDASAELARRVQEEHAEIVAKIAEGNRALADAEAKEREQRATPNTAPAIDAQRIAEEARTAERSRIVKLREIGGKLKLPSEFIERHIETGSDEQAFRSAIVDHLAASDANRAGEPRVTQVEITRDEGETKRNGMVAGLTARMSRAAGERNVEVPGHARAYMEMGLVEIAAECIGWRGHLRTARHVMEMLDEAFARRDWGGHSTSDFPSILLDAMNKRLLARYALAAPTYRRFAAPQTAPDFRTQNVIRAGDFPTLQKVNEHGEIKSGTFSESKETYKVESYATGFTITRQVIINDNLGAIDQVLSSAGSRVADWENALAFASLLSASGAGPTLLTDSTALFHSTHGNLAGSGAAISIDSVGVGRAAMMKQTTLDGMKANFTPATLLTGPDTFTKAEQLLTTITPAQTSNAVPDSMRRALSVVSDANITGNPWYLFADPSIAPTFVYAYLEGFTGPRMSSEQQFSVQGLSVKLEHDFGVSAIDYRGAYRNPGA